MRPRWRTLFGQIDRWVGALVWLAGVGFCALFMSIFALDSGTPEAVLAFALVLAMGIVAGLVPLVRLIAGKRHAERQARPDDQPASIDLQRPPRFTPRMFGLIWPAAGVLALYLWFVSMLTARPPTLTNVIWVGEHTSIEGTVTGRAGPAGPIRLDQADALYNFGHFSNAELAPNGALNAYLRAGDRIHKSAISDALTLDRSGNRSVWSFLPQASPP